MSSLSVAFDLQLLRVKSQLISAAPIVSTPPLRSHDVTEPRVYSRVAGCRALTVVEAKRLYQQRYRARLAQWRDEARARRSR